MPSLMDAQQAWAAHKNLSGGGGVRKKELEAMLKRQQALLWQVKNGNLKLKDNGEKILLKIEGLKAELAKHTAGTIQETLSEKGPDNQQKQQAGLVADSHPPGDKSSKFGAAVLRSVRNDQFALESDPLMSTSNEGCGQDRDSDMDDRGYSESASSTDVTNRSNNVKDRERERERKRREWLSKRERLVEKTQATSASGRSIVRDGKTVRLRSGSLEPLQGVLSSDAVRTTAERVRGQVAKEVEETADKLGQLLTIEEGSPMDVGPTDGPLNRAGEQNGAGSAFLPPPPRTTKFLSLGEAAQLDRKQAEEQREVEDRILSRMPPHVRPDIYWQRDDLNEDESYGDSDEDMSDSSEVD